MLLFAICATTFLTGKEYICNTMKTTQCLCCKKKGTKVWKVVMIQLLYKKGLRKTDRVLGRIYQKSKVFRTTWNKHYPKQTSCYTLWIVFSKSIYCQKFHYQFHTKSCRSTTHNHFHVLIPNKHGWTTFWL